MLQKKEKLWRYETSLCFAENGRDRVSFLSCLASARSGDPSPAIGGAGVLPARRWWEEEARGQWQRPSLVGALRALQRLQK